MENQRALTLAFHFLDSFVEAGDLYDTYIGEEGINDKDYQEMLDTLGGMINIPCSKCERTDLPLHTDGMCPECSPKGREAELFKQAVAGLKEFYPELSSAVVEEIRAKVRISNTGNDQVDYEILRSQVERFVQNWIIDRRV